MKIYLASRLSNQKILLFYREILRNRGHEIQSRWLNLDKSTYEKGFKGSERWKELSLQRAIEDLQDIDQVDAVICYVNKSNTEEISGGMFIECGYAIAKQKKLYIIEPTHNVFFTLPNVKIYETWENLLSEEF